MANPPAFGVPGQAVVPIPPLPLQRLAHRYEGMPLLGNGAPVVVLGNQAPVVNEAPEEGPCSNCSMRKCATTTLIVFFSTVATAALVCTVKTLGMLDNFPQHSEDWYKTREVCYGCLFGTCTLVSGLIIRLSRDPHR